jgi:hypothetical protein
MSKIQPTRISHGVRLQCAFFWFALSFLLSGCPSAMIVGAGTTEYSIFGTASLPESRANIVKKLGPPVETIRLSPPIHLSGIHWQTDQETSVDWMKNHRRGILIRDRYEKGPDGKGHTVRNDPEMTYMEKFTKTGRIVPYGYAGDTMAVSSATMGVGEVVAIPAAIIYKTTGGKTENTFWVWYNASDTPIAYEWEFDSPEEHGVPAPTSQQPKT